MTHRVRNCLQDTIDLADELATFVDGRSLTELSSDPLLTSALEQQVRLVGLGLGRILALVPSLTELLPRATHVVALGDTILREYDALDAAVIWKAATEDIPVLAAQMIGLVNDYPDDEAAVVLTNSLIPLIENNRGTIADLCRQYDIQKLSIFGSAVKGTFDPASSDLDFVVELGDHEPGVARRYVGFADDLERAFGRSVDLVTLHARTRPWFREEVERTAVVVYDRHCTESVEQ